MEHIGLKISDPNICDFIKQENVVDRRIPDENKKKRQSTLHSHRALSQGSGVFYCSDPMPAGLLWLTPYSQP